jgi:hypothetical protein
MPQVQAEALVAGLLVQETEEATKEEVLQAD